MNNRVIETRTQIQSTSHFPFSNLKSFQRMDVSSTDLPLNSSDSPIKPVEHENHSDEDGSISKIALRQSISSLLAPTQNIIPTSQNLQNSELEQKAKDALLFFDKINEEKKKRQQKRKKKEFQETPTKTTIEVTNDKKKLSSTKKKNLQTFLKNQDAHESSDEEEAIQLDGFRFICSTSPFGFSTSDVETEPESEYFQSNKPRVSPYFQKNIFPPSLAENRKSKPSNEKNSPISKKKRKKEENSEIMNCKSTQTSKFLSLKCSECQKTFHINPLEPFVKSNSKKTWYCDECLGKPENLSEEDKRYLKKQSLYLIEKVISEQIDQDKKRYRVRWVGYPPESDSWEPESSICHTKAYQRYIRQRNND